MSQHVRNQHYVPQFLLRNFSSRENRFIWAYDKQGKYSSHTNIKERPIKKVASEEYFYDKIKSSKIDSYEYILQEVEGAAAPVINSLINSRNIKSLSEENRKSIALFIASQLLRTKGKLLQTENSLKNLVKQLRIRWNIIPPKINTREEWLKTLNLTSSLSSLINNKVWGLCEGDNSFIISDNPVVIQNSNVNSKYHSVVGLDSFGVEIYLPLTPSLTLCLFCEKLLMQKKYNKNNLTNISYNDQFVNNLNYLQVINSERFIFSHRNEFGFVKEVLKENA